MEFKGLNRYFPDCKNVKSESELCIDEKSI
jgi:hypothetical protein